MIKITEKFLYGNKIVQQKEHSTENYPSLLITNIVSNLYKKINVIL